MQLSKRTNLLTRPNRRGFTLVELLVVIGIIVVLISILLPALSLARESANRAKCASNLKQWGDVAVAFSTDHNGYFPQCFSTAIFTYWPTVLNTNGSGRTDSSYQGNIAPGADTSLNWQVFGCTIQQLQPYGLVSNLWICPSAFDLGTPVDTPDGNWGQVQWMNYMYVGGASSQQMAKYGADPSGSCNWGNPLPMPQIATPAIKITDTNAYAEILAADQICYITNEYNWVPMAGGDAILYNHRGRDGTLFQNTLYGDGHVVGAPYQRSVGPASPNYAFSAVANQGAYFFWAQ